MTDTIGMGARWVRDFIGGPFVGTHPFPVQKHTRVIVAVDRDQTVGRYVLCNLGWVWVAGKFVEQSRYNPVENL